jgi:hypothetical protein
MDTTTKLSFGKPKPILELSDPMRFEFPYFYVLNEIDKKTDSLKSIDLDYQLIEVRIDANLLRKWNFKKWNFEKVGYYDLLYRIMFHYIKKYIKYNFHSKPIPKNLIVKFNNEDFPDDLDLDPEKLRNPDGALLKLKHKNKSNN